MVRSFYHRLINTILLLAVIIIGVIFVAQNNHLESLALKAEQEGEQEEFKSQAATHGNPAAATLWADSIPGGLLVKDPEPWLPEGHTNGGTLKLLLSTDPKGFNYLIENSVDVSNIAAYNLVPLVARHKKEVTKYGPALAISMERSEDFLTYNYRIRPDVFWHQPALEQEEARDWLKTGASCRAVGQRTAEILKANQPELADVELPADRHWIQGRCRVTAHDIIFWIEMMMNTQVGGAASIRSYFQDLDMSQVKATGDFSFQVKFKSKKYKNDLVSKWFSTLPEFLYAFDEDGARFEDAVIGTRYSEHWYNPRGLGNGPYRFVKFSPGEALELEKDPWFPLGGNSFDKVLLKVVKETMQHPLMLIQSATAKSEAENQGTHITALSPQNFRQVMKKSDKNKLYHDGTIAHDFYDTYGYSYIGWNGDKPLFADKRVRRAMSHAVKADEILKNIRFDLGRRTTGPITPGLPHYDETLKPIPYDLEQAKGLLKEAGWRDTNDNGILDKMINGRRTEFEFTFNIVSRPVHQDTGEVVKESLKKIGIKCNLKPLEWANFQKELHTKKFDAVMLGWGTSPDVDFDQIWHSRQADVPKSSNLVSFRNAEADKIIEAMEFEFDMAKRYELSKQFHRIIYEEQPYTFLFQSKAAYFWTPQLQNATTVGKVRPYLNLRSWYLKQN
ncbi:MAG: ABC transporter substrate-binding protein [Myxococcota bacterium]|nr:ABC transporter substrate-binding protein [Myxococcota bacterium]